jgi:hypothetical protein
MRAARIVPLLLLGAPVAAGAQGPLEDREAAELKCVYAEMSEAERATVVRIDRGNGSAEELDEVTDMIHRHGEVCSQRHGWDAPRMMAASSFAVARSVYENTIASLPPRLSADSLEAAAGTLSHEDRFRFTSAGKAERAPDPAWRERVGAALAAAGVAENDRDAAGVFLEVYHDTLFAMQVFHELWLRARPDR